MLSGPFTVPDTYEGLVAAINSLTRVYRFAEAQHDYEWAREAERRRDLLLEALPTVPKPRTAA